MTTQGVIVALKRVYDEPEPGDGTRVLVERLWPRGLSKERAHVDLWLKEIAPSRELRTWFGHDPEKFAEFRRRSSRQHRQHRLRAGLWRRQGDSRLRGD